MRRAPQQRRAPAHPLRLRGRLAEAHLRAGAALARAPGTWVYNVLALPGMSKANRRKRLSCTVLPTSRTKHASLSCAAGLQNQL